MWPILCNGPTKSNANTSNWSCVCVCVFFFSRQDCTHSHNWSVTWIFYLLKKVFTLFRSRFCFFHLYTNVFIPFYYNHYAIFFIYHLETFGRVLLLSKHTECNHMEWTILKFIWIFVWKLPYHWHCQVFFLKKSSLCVLWMSSFCSFSHDCEQTCIKIELKTEKKKKKTVSN